MNNTYCKKIKKGSNALHVPEDEMKLIASLLNCVNDQQVVSLRQTLKKQIRANGGFKLIRNIKIKIWQKCEGFVNPSKLIQTLTPNYKKNLARFPVKFSEIKY
jgi:hypothetical protein